MRSFRGQQHGTWPKPSWKLAAASLYRVKDKFSQSVERAIIFFQDRFLYRSWNIRFRTGKVLVVAGFRHNSRSADRIPALQAAKTIYTSCNGAPYLRISPKIVGAPEHLSQELSSKLAGGQAVPLQAATVKLKGAAVTAGGVVITNDGKIIEESLINTQLWQSFGILERRGNRKTLRFTGRSPSWRRRIGPGPCVLMKQNWDANYGHWLIEGLPRTALIAEHFDLKQLRFIVADGHGPGMEQVYKDSLSAFGIDPEQLILIGWETIAVDELIYPLPMTAHPWTKSRRVVQILEELAAGYNFDQHGPKRIYVSRNKTPQRRLVNEDEILAMVTKLGFLCVYPETMAFREQIHVFRSAEYIIGNYGAALTNLVFAPRNVSIFALTSQFMQDDFLWDLTSLKDGSYASLHGKALQPDLNYHSDFEINTTEFETMLEFIGVQ